MADVATLSFGQYSDRAEMHVRLGWIVLRPGRQPAPDPEGPADAELSHHSGHQSQLLGARNLAVGRVDPVNQSDDPFTVKRGELRTFHCAQSDAEEALVGGQL